MPEQFPRTMVGGVSMPRMIIGTNWFLGWSHTSLAKDRFIKSYQTAKNVADILTVFFEHGIDAIMGLPNPLLREAIDIAQDRTGRKAILILTPHFSYLPNPPAELDPQRVFEECKAQGATFCFPHQCITDAILDRMHRTIRGMDRYSKMIRDLGMIPGLSTHLPETVVIGDESGADVEAYIQIYNAAGFMMSLEADWVMRIIQEAKKPIMTIKPLAAGRLLPVVGLAFVWNTIREIDMVTVGTTTPDEARELIQLSFDFLNRRIPEYELQHTRSKNSLKKQP